MDNVDLKYTINYGIKPLENEKLPTESFTLYRVENENIPDDAIAIDSNIYDKIVSTQSGSWNNGTPIPARKLILKSINGKTFDELFDVIDNNFTPTVDPLDIPLEPREQRALKEAVEILTLEMLRK